MFHFFNALAHPAGSLDHFAILQVETCCKMLKGPPNLFVISRVAHKTPFSQCENTSTI